MAAVHTDAPGKDKPGRLGRLALRQHQSPIAMREVNRITAAAKVTWAAIANVRVRATADLEGRDRACLLMDPLRK